MDTVERHVTLPTDLEDAWELLTRPDDLAAWLGAEVVLDPTPGAAGRGRRPRRHAPPPGGRRGRGRAAASPGAGGPTATTPTQPAGSRSRCVPTDGGTLVRVVEQLLPQPTPALRAEARASAGEAWSHRLLHLEALLLVAAAVRG